MAREPTKPTDASACAPVPAIDVAIIGPQKAPLLGTHARSDPALFFPRPHRNPIRIRNTEQKALKAQTTKPKPRPEPHAALCPAQLHGLHHLLFVRVWERD